MVGFIGAIFGDGLALVSGFFTEWVSSQRLELEKWDEMFGKR